MLKSKLLICFGGESTEHDVSLDSAEYIYSLIDKDRYDVFLCFVDSTGKWWHVDDLSDLQPATEVYPVLGRGELLLDSGQRIKPDIIFPIMLGSNGEDGSVQALAQLLHIPVVGCGVTASAICMDKCVTKQLLEQAQIPNAKYKVFYANRSNPSYASVKSQLGGRVFIKPSSQGSSVGVSRATNQEEFYRGLEKAFAYDNKVLIEEAIEGLEITCGVIGTDKLRVSEICEIRIGGDDFYTYDAKYSKNSTTKKVIPSTLPQDLQMRIYKIVKDTYTTLGCSGYARVDIFVEESGTIMVNEVNTIPAFKEGSTFPQMWKAAGANLTNLLTEIIQYSVKVESEPGERAS